MMVKSTITLNQYIFIFGQSLTKTLEEEMDINCPLKLAIQLKKKQQENTQCCLKEEVFKQGTTVNTSFFQGY